MRPENKALAIVVLLVTVVVVVGLTSIYYFAQLPSSLPIPAGTVFSGNDTKTWVAYFQVAASGGRLVGGWTPYRTLGLFAEVELMVANGTLSRPGGIVCPLVTYGEGNGSIDQMLGSGTYSLYWGVCNTFVDRIVVTRTIQLVSP